ncbi:hypothetical protein MHO82_14335 [Vibrio sp. Of7-15]|uniref:hypothetical protein n=1 Tax=Vibrio sp. Of7-15 TaxID=2724879 RepID=UPI001EF2B737|nr:hypothetical protein [Vibrio sp. Of7-15]MCG7498045.1 hypothetical protein [Vibrio sp. Of7-15]
MRYSALFILMAAAGSTYASDWTEVNNLQDINNTPSWLSSAYEYSDSASVIKSDLYINLSDWVEEQNLHQVKPASLVIVADTLDISDTFSLSVKNQSIVIFARKIVGNGRAIFTLGNESSASSVTVISERMESPIDIISTLDDGSVEIQSILNTKEQISSSVLLAGNFYRATQEQDELTGYLQIGTEAYRDVFNKSFDMATQVFSQSPETSLALLDWIETIMRKSSNIVKADPLLSDLYLQALAFKQFVYFSGKDSNYVPYLDHQLYKDKYEAYIDAMVTFQDQYDIVTNQSNSEDDKLQSATLAAAQISDVINAEKAIIDRTQTNIDKINDRLLAVKAQYDEQDRKVLAAKTQYLIGVDKWKRKQELNAALSIFKAIAELGSAVSGIFTGNLSGINDVTEQLTTEVPDAITKAKNLVTNIKSLTSVIDSITKTVGGIASLTNEVKGKIVQDKIANAVDGFNFTVPSIDESNTAWDAMLIELRSNLRYADSLGIVGARAFLVELEKQVLFGKAVNATQLRLVTEQSKLIDMVVTAEVSKNQQARLDEMISQIHSKQASIAQVERELSRALNHFKRPIYVALSSYSHAFKYWALKDSEVTPSLEKSYLDYKLDLATIEDEYLRALESFQPTPHDFTIDNIIIDDPETIAEFADSGVVNFSIASDESKFCRFDRVRINTIRVMLEGENLPYGDDYYLSITNTGNYLDRYQGEEYEFSALPLSRAFYYRLDDAQNNQVSIITDGAVAKQLSFVYFEPTPFTTWSARLQNHEYYSLNSVERIRVTFKGIGIPNGKPCR